MVLGFLGKWKTQKWLLVILRLHSGMVEKLLSGLAVTGDGQAREMAQPLKASPALKRQRQVGFCALLLILEPQQRILFFGKNIIFDN